MTRLRVFLFRLRSLFQKRKLEQELADEIQSHLEMQMEDDQHRGMTADDARYSALRKFGGVDQVKEVYRERRGLPFIETLFRDLGYGFRMLRRSPGITAVAIFSLALGIGANTALFSVVDAVFLRTLPVEAPEQLVIFEWKSGRAFRLSGMSGTSNIPTPPNMRGLSLFRYDVFERMQQSRLAAAADSPLNDLFAFGPIREMNVRVGDDAEIIDGQAVSGGYYSGLKVQPSLGRPITPEDDKSSATPVVLLSDRYWRERFNASDAVIGQQIVLSGKSFTIIGVTPPEFRGTLQVNYQPDVTIPLALEPFLVGEKSRLGNASKPGVWWLNVMGRLKPGGTVEQARESLNATFQSAALEFMPPPRKAKDPAQIDPKDYPRLFTEPGSQGMQDTRKSYAPAIYGLFIVVGLVLLIACANLANLLLARATLRRPEISVRLAVGAGRWRLIQQLLTESLLLAALGGVVGIFFAFWGKAALATMTNEESGLVPPGVELSLNWRVLLFTLLISLLTTLLFGLVPAWKATSLNLTGDLKHSARITGGVSRLSQGLLVVQVALSALLLTGAGLMIRTLSNLDHVNLGFNQDNLLVFRLQPDQGGYEDERLVKFYQQLFERLDHLPGVKSATFGRVQLISNNNWSTDFLLPGEVKETAPVHDTMRQTVRENYFTTMEMPFRRGREFTAQDDQHAPRVGIVNETFVRNFFPHEEVLGKRIRFSNENEEIEIVGVVADTKYESQREEITPLFFTPWQQDGEAIAEMFFALRTDGEPTALAGPVRRTVRELDRNLPVSEIGTQSARSQATLEQDRLYARLLSFFGALALLLAAIGLFGVLAHSVSQRTKEIGIRMAFGAQINNVLRLVIWQGMKLVLVGLAASAVIGFALRRLLASRLSEDWQRQLGERLYGVKLTDPLTLSVIVALLIFVALIACWLPARRAAKVDPLVALRYE